jgi:ABC-2 type transport system permease protein
LQRLLTTPITAAQTIAGHVLGMFVIILAEELVLVLAGQLLFGVNYAQSPFAVLLILVALALFAASLGLLISALAKTEDQVIIYALVAMMLLSTLGGAQFPLEIAGEAFATVGSILPSYWAMQGLQNVIVRGQGVASVLKPVAILIAYALGTFVLAVWRFSFEGD